MGTRPAAGAETSSRAAESKGEEPGIVDKKLEVVVIPVSDVDRAKEFYAGLGWRLDADVAPATTSAWSSSRLRAPGARSSSARTSRPPHPAPAQGLYLIVSDIEAARDELADRGVEVSEVFHEGAPGAAGSGTTARTVASAAPRRSSQLRLIRLVQRPRRQRLAVPGGHDPASRARRPGRDFVRLGERPGRRAAARVGRPRRAREAHRQGRRELARLVRRSTWWREQAGTELPT